MKDKVKLVENVVVEEVQEVEEVEQVKEALYVVEVVEEVHPDYLPTEEDARVLNKVLAEV